MENNDNKTENYILEQIFLDKKVIKKITDIYDLINNKEKINFWDNENFISKFYKKIWFVKETFIWDTEKKEILCLFFWENFNSSKEIENKIKYFLNDISSFRELNIENKWFIFHFIDIIIDTKINIDNNYFLFLKETKNDKLDLINLSKELIINWLDVFYEEIVLLLDSYKDFFDKYLSFNNNYLSKEELDWFKNHFLELFNNLFSYITSNTLVIDKITEIEKRINNNISFD